MAKCILESFSTGAYSSHTHCRLTQDESNENLGDLEQVAELHGVNLQ